MGSHAYRAHNLSRLRAREGRDERDLRASVASDSVWWEKTHNIDGILYLRASVASDYGEELVREEKVR